MTSYDQVISLNSRSHVYSDMIQPDEKSTRSISTCILVQIFTSCTNFIELYFAFTAWRRFQAIPCYSYWITESCKNPNFGAIIVWPVFKNMFVAREIHAEHKDLIHDVSYDYHGRRMATCSSDQSVKASAWNINCIVCQNLVEQKLWDRA